MITGKLTWRSTTTLINEFYCVRVSVEDWEKKRERVERTELDFQVCKNSWKSIRVKCTQSKFLCIWRPAMMTMMKNFPSLNALKKQLIFIQILIHASIREQTREPMIQQISTFYSTLISAFKRIKSSTFQLTVPEKSNGKIYSIIIAVLVSRNVFYEKWLLRNLLVVWRNESNFCVLINLPLNQNCILCALFAYGINVEHSLIKSNV